METFWVNPVSRLLYLSSTSIVAPKGKPTVAVPGGWAAQISRAGAAGLIVIDVEVPAVSLVPVASSSKVPAVSIAMSENFATPLTALTVSVPTIVPVALFASTIVTAPL